MRRVMTMSDKPTIYGHCASGCKWEVPHKAEVDELKVAINNFPVDPRYVFKASKWNVSWDLEQGDSSVETVLSTQPKIGDNLSIVSDETASYFSVPINITDYDNQYAAKDSWYLTLYQQTIWLTGQFLPQIEYNYLNFAFNNTCGITLEIRYTDEFNGNYEYSYYIHDCYFYKIVHDKIINEYSGNLSTKVYDTGTVIEKYRLGCTIDLAYEGVKPEDINFDTKVNYPIAESVKDYINNCLLYYKQNLYIRYATDEYGSNMNVAHLEGYDYVGFYMGSTPSPEASDYQWFKFADSSVELALEGDY